MTMEELVETADSLVGELAPKQTRYKVTERPDARTIRYYVTQGLLPKPLGYDGGRARYGGTHLLRLLFIKKLQTEHHTLTQIAKRLEGRNDRELLDDLGSDTVVDDGTVTAAEAPRLTLEPGGTVEVPPDVLADPEKRKRLAESLEALAAWIRSTAGKP